MALKAGELTPGEAAPPVLASEDKWKAWGRLGLEDLAVPYWVLIALAGLAVLAEQLLEVSLGGGSLSLSSLPPHHFVLPVLTAYMLLMLRVLRHTAVPQLAMLRPYVKIDDKGYDESVYQMVHVSTPRQALLFLASLGVVSIWFLLLNNPMPTASRVHLPADTPTAAFIFFVYVLFGWFGLNIVFATIQFGRGLGRLSRQPLVINVFDPTHLLPFGRMALVHSFTAAGIILILLIGLGSPGALIDWLVIFLASTASVLALILPLLGVHYQMREAKTEMLLQCHGELERLNTLLHSGKEFEPTDLAAINNHISALVSLRKTAIEGPNWPFQNTVTTSRAVLVATSPLIYFVLTEIIRVILVPVLPVAP